MTTTDADFRSAATNTLAQASLVLFARDPALCDVYGLRPDDADDADDADDEMTVTARGITCQGTIAFGRDVVLPDGRPDRTATTLKVFASDDLHRLSNLACQQHRRDLVEVPDLMDHPNGCTGYVQVAILAERKDHPRVRARLAAFYGETALFKTNGGLGARTGKGDFVVVDRAAAERYGRVPPEIAGDPCPCYLAMEIAAPNLARVRPFLEFEAHRYEDGRILLTDAARFGNVFLAFVGPTTSS